MTSKPTYSAVTVAGRGTGDTWYSNMPNGNLVGDLPLGARPKPRGECGTLDRTDGGDPFERALFDTPCGRVIEIRRDQEGR